MKTLFYLFMSFVCLVSTTQAENKVHIVAIVNGHTITQLDLENRLKLMLMDAQQLPSDEQKLVLRRNLVDKMIDEILQVEEAKRYGIEASQEDVKNHLDFVSTQNNWSPGHLEKTLQAEGIPQDILINQIKAGIAWAKFTMLLREGAKISDKDIENHMRHKRHKVRYLLAEIVLPFSSPSQAMGAEQMAQQVFQEIQNGKPFNMMAFEHSGTPTAASGGDIDWVDEDQLLPEVLEVVERMPVGALSQPIPTGHDYRLILLREKQDPNQLEQILKLRQLEVALPMMMPVDQRHEEIQKLETKMSPIKNCADFEAMADRIDNATLQIHQNINTGQLSGGLEQVVASLPLNTPSKALPVPDHKLMIFMVCERADKLSDGVDAVERRKEIQESIANKKLDSLATKRIQDLRRQAYLDVRL